MVDNYKKKSPDDDGGIWKDPRFSHLVNDPRFHQMPKAAHKVKIDKRFQPMFSDDKFNLKYTVDKYGRKVNKSSSEDLEKYYKLESSSDEDVNEEEARKEEEAITKSVENDELETKELEALPSNIVKKLCESDLDYARGEGRLLSDSSSDEETTEDEEEDDEMFIEHVWGELDRDTPRTDDSTRRLAACNMDWDRIRASDIMVLCNSFLPPGGSILSVKIYPSEFGRQRMAEEDVHGPPELTRQQSSGDDSNSDEELLKEADSDAEEGDEYHMEKLRQYQLSRLKYYYAVIECDSVRTADKIYAECDGMEYESTATKLDLRFVPDDTTFDEDEPKDVCTELPNLAKYQPRLFTTSALQQAKVELTWDETNVERKELSEKLCSGKLTEVNDADLREIVAYSSEEDSSSEKDEKIEDTTVDVQPEKNSLDKYKSLLLEINKSESEKVNKKYEMEYTWGINVNDKKSKDTKEPKKNLTPIEKVLQKRSEKNKRRKEERRKRKLGSDASESSDDIPSDVDLNDPYFAEEFANGDFKHSDKKKKPKNSRKVDASENSDDNDGSNRNAKELELLLEDDEIQDDKEHFSLKKIQEAENETKSKKRRMKLKKSRKEIEAAAAAKTKTEDDFQVNLQDNRFSAVYTSHLFNIDPTDSRYKKTKGMEAIIREKFKRRGNDDRSLEQNAKLEWSEDMAPKRSKKTIENSILIKNIKKKLNANK